MTQQIEFESGSRFLLQNKKFFDLPLTEFQKKKLINFWERFLSLTFSPKFDFWNICYSKLTLNFWWPFWTTVKVKFKISFEQKSRFLDLLPVKSCPLNWDHATMLALGWNNYIIQLNKGLQKYMTKLARQIF